jgi:hypothetical protein
MSHGDLIARLQEKVAASFAALRGSIPANYPMSQTPQLRGQANRMGEGFLAPWADSR